MDVPNKSTRLATERHRLELENRCKCSFCPKRQRCSAEFATLRTVMLCSRASIHARNTLAISPSEKACVNLSAVGVFVSAQHLPMFHSAGASKRASHMRRTVPAAFSVCRSGQNNTPILPRPTIKRCSI
jgi:hypothetical protein